MKGTILPQSNGQVKPLSDYVIRKLLRMVELAGWSRWWDAPPESLQDTIADLKRSGLTPQTCQKARLIPLSYFLRQIEETTARRFIKVLIKLSSSRLSGRDLLKEGELLGFPYFSRDGELLFVRIRSYPPLVFKDEDGDEREVKYLQPKGTPVLPYILPEVWSVAQKPHKPIWLTEGEKKALSLVQKGRYAIALSGVWNFRAGEETARTEEDKDLWQELQDFNWSGRVVYLGFDMDVWTNPQVRMALFELGIKLISRGAVVRVPFWDKSLKGIDDFLSQHPDRLDEIEDRSRRLEDVIREEDLEGVVKALSKVELTPERREQLYKNLTKRLGVRFSTLERAVWRKAKEEAQEQGPAFPEEVLREAQEVLKGDIVGRLLQDLKKLYAGRERVKLLLYLIVLSRKVLNLESNPCIILRGEPGAGKSQLVRTILSLFDEKDYMEISYQTPKFLYHLREDLRHRVLFFTEWSGTLKAGESIKLSITEKGLSWAGVEKTKEGQLVSVYKHILTLPMPIISTAVDPPLSKEMLSRTMLVSLVGDKSLFEEAVRVKWLVPQEEKEKVRQLWRAIDSLLEKAEVHIPWMAEFVEGLCKKTESGADIRDQERFISLIKASAVLHQHQRERDEKGRILATEQDYRIAYSLVDFFVEARGGLPPDVLAVAEVVQELTAVVDGETRHPTRQQVIARVMERMGKSEPTVVRWLQKAQKMEVLTLYTSPHSGREKLVALNMEEIPRPTIPFPTHSEVFCPAPDDTNDTNHTKALIDKEKIHITTDDTHMIRMISFQTPEEENGYHSYQTHITGDDINSNLDTQGSEQIHITHITNTTDKTSRLWSVGVRPQVRKTDPKGEDIRILKETINRALRSPYKVDYGMDSLRKVLTLYVMEGPRVIGRAELSLEEGLDYGQCFDAVEQVIRQGRDLHILNKGIGQNEAKGSCLSSVDTQGSDGNKAIGQASESDYLTALSEEFKRLKKQGGPLAERITYYYNSYRKEWELIKGNETTLKLPLANGLSLEECLRLLRRSFEDALRPSDGELDF